MNDDKDDDEVMVTVVKWKKRAPLGPRPGLLTMSGGGEGGRLFQIRAVLGKNEYLFVIPQILLFVKEQIESSLS